MNNIEEILIEVIMCQGAKKTEYFIKILITILQYGSIFNMCDATFFNRSSEIF